MVRRILVAGLVLGVLGCTTDDATVLTSSRAYKGHENDQDMTYFVNAYGATQGTRLDDCQTCHGGRQYTYDSSGTTKTLFKNACDNCHLMIHPDSTLIEAQPTTYADTLNPYGKAYLDGGRSRAALAAIESADSDGDGAANRVEIDALRYPGDAASKPGQPSAASRTFTLAELQAMPLHTQFLLANSAKQQFDTYASYGGAKLKDLLIAAGVDVTDAAFEGVTVIAPDGFMIDFKAEEVTGAYPSQLFHAGLDTATLGTVCGFVEYPDTLPTGLTDGVAIPGDFWLDIAYQREGLPLDVSTLDPVAGKINGEGPLRLVVPQTTPGKPDRGSKFSPTDCADGNDFDNAKDHNAGDMVRGVVAIRVNPLPAGVEDFDTRYGGWAFIDSESVMVYGHGVTAK
jgi:hypothetical protein